MISIRFQRRIGFGGAGSTASTPGPSSASAQLSQLAKNLQGSSSSKAPHHAFILPKGGSNPTKVAAPVPKIKAKKSTSPPDLVTLD